LVGRDAALEEALCVLSTGARLLTLRGPPGVGKSTVARALGRQLSSTVTVVLVDHDLARAPVAGQDPRASVLAALAAALGLGLRTRDTRVMLDRVARALDERAATLVLDQIDAMLPVVRGVVADLLDGTEALRVVVCAWRALGLPTEHVLRLEPLAPSDAARLLAQRVARQAPSRMLSAEDSQALVAHAGALPLGLELLAARVAELGAPAVLSALERHGLVSDALDRVLDAAWSLLEPAEQDALVALSVLARPCTPAIAELLVGEAGDARALCTLERLCACSLLQTYEDQDGVTVGLVDGIRSYALRRARARGLEDQARARHATLLARPSPPRPDDVDAWRRVQREREDLLAAWRWAGARADAQASLLALRLAVQLDPVLLTQGPSSLHRRVLEDTLALVDGPLAHASTIAPPRSPEHDVDALTRALDPDGAARTRDDGTPPRGHDGDVAAAAAIDLRLALGRYDAIRGHHRRALDAFTSALEAADTLGDDARAGWAAAFACFSAGHTDDRRAAGGHGERALGVARRTRDLRLTAMAEQALGFGALVHGELGEAEALLRRAVAAARLAGAPRLVGICVANLGLVHLERGGIDRASTCLAEAHQAFVAIDDRFHLARLAVHEALLAVRRGEPEAEVEVTRALERVVALDDLEGELCARAALVELARTSGDPPLAERRWDELSLCVRRADDVSWPRKLAALAIVEAGPPRGHMLRLSRDGRTLELSGRPVDFSRRGPLRRVLLALVEARLAEPGRALSAVEVQAAGWPGEKMYPESGAARVYMAVRRLRELGLEAALLTRDEGYALDPTLDIAWSG
jgi:tetratricopeptide (TPR) repeat protein